MITMCVVKDLATKEYVAENDQWTSDITKAKRLPVMKAESLARYLRNYENRPRAYAIEVSTAVDTSKDGG